jgi:uncharacterized protein (TIGR00251 family)
VNTDSSLLIPVRVQARGSSSEIVGVVDGRLKIKTAAPPTDGRANKDVARQLASAFGVPPSRVSLRNGASSRLKTFLVDRPAKSPGWLKDIAFR